LHTDRGTGSAESIRVKIKLTIEVENIEYDSMEGVLHLNGRNTEENEYVKLGAYHTLDLEVNRSFALIKSEWDTISLERLQKACDVAQRADVAVIVMQEGLAHVCLITENMTVLRQKIDMNIPKKRRGDTAQYEKSMEKFFSQVMQALLRNVDFSIVKCVIIGSPGFLKENFFQYLLEEAVRTDEKVILENKSKFLLLHASSGHKASIKEILQDHTMISKLADTKAATEAKVLQQFYNMLHHEASRAFYGSKHVMMANEKGAVETLLLSDSLLR
jgi:protein pelota